MRPAQSQLLLPLLDVLHTAPGGKHAASDACQEVAIKVGVDRAAPEAIVTYGDRKFNGFDRDVRWARQRAVFQGLLATPERGQWQITGKGRKALRQARPGVVVTLFENESGAALWASCEDACKLIEDGSVQAIITSPPYPLLREKDYGNLDERDHVEWLTSLAAQWRPLLTGDGSLVLNLGDTWQKGAPVQSLYAERLLLRLVDELGYKLCQRFEWYNPAKMPAPAEWVTVRRVRVKPALERCYWLSLNDHPYADNRNVLQPYSKSMQRVLDKGGQGAAQRPSGFAMADGAFAANNGGAIPPNLITAANTDSGSSYMQTCRAAGLPIHPARFPGALPRFFINMLTRPGDLVFEPFSGSGKTAFEAQQLGRRFVSSELVLDYAEGQRLWNEQQMRVAA